MLKDSSNYRYYSEEEFAADEYFQQWVLLPDEESNQFWESFARQHSDKRIVVQNAIKLVKHLAQTGFHLPFLTATEKESLKHSILTRIETIPSPEPFHRFRRRRTSWWLLVAASLILIFSLRFLLLPVKPVAFASEVTEMRQVKKILLPDSSLVILNGNSSLRYNHDFLNASKREVFLEGNAYFKVKPSSTLSPFIVHTNQLKIYVTGTEFNVNARDNHNNVVLTRGKINVTLEKEKRRTVYLESGYSLDVDTINNEFITRKASTEFYTAAWNLGEWHFEDTPLSTVARLIGEYYGTEMVFTSPEQEHLRITAIVSVDDFSTLIHVIEKTLNIHIQTKNQQLIIINPQSKQL